MHQQNPMARTKAGRMRGSRQRVKDSTLTAVYYCLFDTIIGECGLAWLEPDGDETRPVIRRLQFPEATSALTESRLTDRLAARGVDRPPEAILLLIDRIRRHLLGEWQDFRAVELDLTGMGPFTRQVLEMARSIPSGETASYGEVARRLSRPGAARAVGQALGRNPVGLIVPCHRVLAAGGQIGGFSAHGGQSTKMRLLAIEGIERAPAG